MKSVGVVVSVLSLMACSTQEAPIVTESYYGTLEPFASKAVYFVVTDRFVNGDVTNDQRGQATGPWHTFDRPVPNAPVGESDNIGYLGGDFKGVLDNADYIRDLGFDAVWITPIVDNPDAAFSGGKPVDWASFWTDQGKTGYHGYWGVNFFKLDEHLPSADLDFAAFTKAMDDKKLDVVLDIVANHGSPSFTMPELQPEFAKLYDQDGKLVADHQNLHPEQLDPNNPLHRFFTPKAEIAELSNFNDSNPDVLEYMVAAHEQWVAQGADAIRIDTIGWMQHSFWKQFADRIRAKRPGFFMFGEDFRYEANDIAPHTWAENGAISVLDFPLKKAIAETFENPDSDYAALTSALYLENGPYANPYDLMTFYDNHDMPRMNASDHGFIDAHNWLFTARGIPVVYYGSEVGFMRGKAEHAGNRNYFGQEAVAASTLHPIYKQLKRIANARRDVIALQRGIQLNIELKGDRAAFYRIYQHEGQAQIALVLLNKADESADFVVSEYLEAGQWQPVLDGETQTINGDAGLTATVAPHDVAVYVLNKAVTRADLKARLATLMNNKSAKR